MSESSVSSSAFASFANFRASDWPRKVALVLLGGLGLMAAAVLSGLVLLAIALSVAYPNLPAISGLVDYRPKLPLRVFASDGTLIGEYGEERRNFTPIREIPKIMQDAVLAIEDARFREHSGVDYKGVLRAFVRNFADDARSQGGSTITMQVARNFYLSTEKTYTRKIYEVLLALKIENELTKDQILELYMNHIFLGRRAYGFSAACEIYFGKPLKDITIAEAAMLAGLPAAPSAYNPSVNPKRAQIRQRYIVERMLENGYITPQQREEALAQQLKYRANTEVPVHAEYVAEAARQLVFSQYGEATYTRGLNVFTSVRMDDQVVAYQALRKGLLDYERRQVYRGPEGFVNLPADPKLVDARIAEALEDHPDNDDLRAAVVLEAGPRKLVATLQNGDQVTVTGDNLRAAASGLADRAPAKVRVRRGSIVRLVRNPGPKGEWAITQQPEVEGAFVAMDPRTGEVRALVGGFDYAKNKFNHVTQAWRQPGSSFKPFIYSAALEKGFTPATVVNDAPLFYDADMTRSQPWEPKNYDGQFEGPMSLRRGLAKSKNMVSIRVVESMGPEFAQEWATRFGFEPERHPAFLTLALGVGTVTPLQMAGAYSVFANGGYRVNPVLVTRLTDTRGRVLVEAKPSVLDESTRCIEPRNAFVMGSLLQEVTRSGTAARAYATMKRADIYGKTGTTNDSNDAWFAGYQPTVVSVVWIGYDQPRKLGDRETGGGLALPVWIDYMSHALKNVPVAERPVPPGVSNVGGEWYYDEYAHGGGITAVGLEETLPSGGSAPPPEEDKKSILDLFRGE